MGLTCFFSVHSSEKEDPYALLHGLTPDNHYLVRSSTLTMAQGFTVRQR